MRDRQKAGIVTFKAEREMVEALRGISNRSEFIRSAVLSALRNTCPLCRGSGALSPRQREHWDAFARSHKLVECRQCHHLHLVCDNEAAGKGRKKEKR